MVEGKVCSRDPKTGLKRVSGSVYIEGVNVGGQALPFSALEQLNPELAGDIVARLQQEELTAQSPLQADFRADTGGLVFTNLKPLVGEVVAHLRMAQDMISEGILLPRDALLCLEPGHFVKRCEPAVREYGKAVRAGSVVAGGHCIYPGAAVGRLAFDSQSAWDLSASGEGVVLVVESLELCHRDALLICDALLIREQCARAPVSIPCVSGLGDVNLLSGESYTVFSSRAEVLTGRLPLRAIPTQTQTSPLLQLTDKWCPIEVRINFESLDSLRDSLVPEIRRIGLARVESFFQASDKFSPMRDAIFAVEYGDAQALETFEGELVSALEQLLDYLQEGDAPVLTVRLFDSPLGWTSRLWKLNKLHSQLTLSPLLQNCLHELSATQAMRGGRFSRLFPQFFDAQVRALTRAQERYPKVRLEMMLPGIGSVEEAKFFVERARGLWTSMDAEGLRTGMMLESPRACLLAHRFLPYCEFFSFGTGDLTEATWALSRYDAPIEYLSKIDGEPDPFETLDQEGVGELMRIACRNLRSANPEAEIGWCGAQAANHSDLAFVRELKLDYLSVPGWAAAKVKVSLAQQALVARSDS